MDEYVFKQKIQNAFSEPRAVESLIQQVILRARAVSMGAQAQKELDTAPVENAGKLVSRVLIGRLAAVSELPKGSEPERLAQQLEEDPNFVSAIRGGNILQKLHSGELIRQIVKEKSILDDPLSEITVPAKESPQAPNVG